jgi:hypothetical protein
LDDKWNGRINTSILGGGTYAYVVDVAYIDDFGEGKEQIVGDITLFE